MSFFNKDAIAKEIQNTKTKRRHTIGYKGILKDISNNNGSLNGSDSDANKNKHKRRVSFAPEVTLHKISIVPQFSLRSNSSASLFSDENSDVGDGKSQKDTVDQRPPQGKGNGVSDEVTGTRRDGLEDGSDGDSDVDSEHGEVHQSPFLNKIIAMQDQNLLNNDGTDENAEATGYQGSFHSDDDNDSSLSNSFTDNMDLTEIKIGDIFKQAKDGSGRKTLDINEINSFEAQRQNPSFPKVNLLDDVEQDGEAQQNQQSPSGDAAANSDEGQDQEVYEEVAMDITESFKNSSRQIKVLDVQKQSEINTLDRDIDQDEEMTTEVTMEITQKYQDHVSQDIEAQRVNDSPTTLQNPEKENEKDLVDQEMLDEETMELTKPISIPSQLKAVKLIEATTASTEQVGGSQENSGENSGENSEEQQEETMEFTKPISIPSQQKPAQPQFTSLIPTEESASGERNANNQEQEEETMEFTKPISLPSKAVLQLNIRPKVEVTQKESNGNEDSEKTAPSAVEQGSVAKKQGDFETGAGLEQNQEEQTMEFTKPIRFTPAQPLAASNQIQLEDSNATKAIKQNSENDENHDEETMEITKRMNTPGLQPPHQTVSKSSDASVQQTKLPGSGNEAPNFFSKVKNLLPNLNPNVLKELVSGNTSDVDNPEKLGNDKETMESTKSVSVNAKVQQPAVIENERQLDHQPLGNSISADKADSSNDYSELGDVTREDIRVDQNDHTAALHSPTKADGADTKGQEGIQLLEGNDIDSEPVPEQTDDDSDIFPDEKTLSNTIANSMLGQSAPITSSPIKDDGSEAYGSEKVDGLEPIELEENGNSNVRFESPEKLNSPVKVNFGSSPISENEDENDPQTQEPVEQSALSSPQRQKKIIEKVEGRALPLPSTLSTSPLRKALSTKPFNENELPAKSFVTSFIPALNFKDQEIFKPSSSIKRKRHSLSSLSGLQTPESKKQKSQADKKKANKRKTISFGPLKTRYINTIEEETNQLGVREDDLKYVPKPAGLDDPFIDSTAGISAIPVLNITASSLEQQQDVSIEDDDYEPATIQDFLEEINIKFFDDMVHSTILSTSLLPKRSARDKPTSQLDYGASNEQLSTLELLTYGCKELKKYVKEGQEFFDQLAEEIAEENPALMKEFFTSLPEVKASMIEQFHISKNHAKLEAQNDWYVWKSQLIDDIISIIEKRLKDLEVQKKGLDEKLADYGKLSEKLLSKQQDIEKKLHQVTFQNMFLKKNNLSKEELLVLRAELVQVTNSLIEAQESLANQEIQALEIASAVESKKQEIETLQESIKKKEETLSRSNSLESHELYKLKLRLEELIKQSGIKLVSVDKNSSLITIRLLVNSYDESTLFESDHTRNRRASSRKSIINPETSISLSEEKNNNVDVTFNYECPKMVDSFKFKFGKNFKFNEKIYSADSRNCSAINSQLLTFFEKSFQDARAGFTDVLTLFSFFRKALAKFKSTFAQLYYLTIKSRAKVNVLEKSLSVDMRVNVKSMSKRKTIRMELPADYMRDLFPVGVKSV